MDPVIGSHTQGAADHCFGPGGAHGQDVKVRTGKFVPHPQGLLQGEFIETIEGIQRKIPGEKGSPGRISGIDFDRAVLRKDLLDANQESNRSIHFSYGRREAGRFQEKNHFP
jgi:hypothetical protein